MGIGERESLIRAHLRDAGIEAPSAGLDAYPWAYETATFISLRSKFRIRTNDENFGRFLDDAFAGMRVPLSNGDAEVTSYSVLMPGQLHGALYRGVEMLYWSLDSSVLFSRLLWTINQTAIQSQPSWVKLHAGSVERDGIGVLLPAPMESGKSTLTAGLVLRGYRYLSDEMAAIRVTDGLVDAYPKPLGLDPGSWPLLPEFAPDRPEFEPYQQDQWQVPVRRFSGGTAASAIPRVIVMPAYGAGAGTRLVPLDGGEAVAALVACAFDGEQASATSIRTLARVVVSAECYRLQHDDLATACEALDEVVGALSVEP